MATKNFQNEIFNLMVEGAMVVGFNGSILYLNHVAEKHSRLEKETSVGRNLFEILPGLEKTPLYHLIKSCLQDKKNGRLIQERIYSDLTKAWFDFTITPISDGILISSVDITDHILNNKQVHKLNRVYAVLSDINQTIVRIRDPQILFNRACQIAVEKGKFLLACIGWINQDTNKFVWRACAGTEYNFMENYEIDLKTPRRKQHPMVRALINGQIWVDNKLDQNANQDDWRRRALQNNFHSSVAFPLIVFGKVMGVLNLFAGEIDYFNDEELTLLSEMSMDLSFALEFTEQENKRRVFEEALEISEARYRSLFENMQEGMAYCRMLYEENQPIDFEYLEVNKNFESLTGLINPTGKKVTEIIPGIRESNPELFETYSRVALSGVPEKMETYLPALDMWFSISVYCPKKEYFVAVFDIITERKRQEDNLRESEQRFRTAFENSIIGFTMLSVEGKFTKINKAFCEMLGYEEAEIVGHPVTEFTLPEDQDLSLKVIDELIKGVRKNIKFEKRYLHQNGQVIWCEIFVAPIYGAAEKVLYFVSQVQDITQRKLAETEILNLNAELDQRVRQRTAELSDLYNNAPCGYHSLNRDGLVVNINDTELEWLGYSRQQVINQVKFPEFLTPDSKRIFGENFPQFLELGYIHDLELELVRKNGSILPVIVNATAIKDTDGQVLASRSTLIDNTGRKQAEMEMLQSQALLKAANYALERTNKELEAFSYSVSHDLRQPLRAIEGYSQIIKNDYAAKIDPDGIHLFDSIQSNSKKMDSLITDLLSLARLNRLEMNFSKINMKEMAQGVYEELISAERKPKFELSIGDLPWAVADATLIRQVWVNLISNAIKYTAPKSACKIEIGGSSKDGISTYYVKDNGVGFDPNYAQKLFGVFQRLHKANEFEGTGVGLAIVQRIINRHGGTTWAEGQVDQGATFYFSLKIR